MSNGKFLAGILMGVAAGAVLGILFAPEKGEDTRKKIKKRTSKMGDDLKAKFDEMADSFKKKFNDIKEDADEMMEQARQQA